MKKPIIIALVGASGSGKTSLSLFLQDKLNVPAIVSFTTRSMREGEVNGRDHYFVTEDELPPKEKLFAYTKFGGHHYWTLKTQFNHPIVTYVVDEKGLLDLYHHHEYKVISVLIERPDNPTPIDRQTRDKNRLHINKSNFDLILTNNSSEKNFHQLAILKIGSKIKK